MIRRNLCGVEIFFIQTNLTNGYFFLMTFILKPEFIKDIVMHRIKPRPAMHLFGKQSISLYTGASGCDSDIGTFFFSMHVLQHQLSHNLTQFLIISGNNKFHSILLFRNIRSCRMN